MTKLPRHKRVKDPPPMRLTPRDVEIIKAVHDCRVLQGEQLQALFFGSQSTASYRLSRLYQHGFLDRHFLPEMGGLANSPALYTIGKRGLEVLRDTLDGGPEGIRRRLGGQELSVTFLKHTLAINDVRIVITLAARQHGYHLETWLDDAELKADYDYVTVATASGRKKEISLIPDSYFVLQVPQGQACFFLELDRNTMQVARFKTKIQAYQTYVKSGAYEQRFHTRSLRVLTVTPGPKRLESLKQATENVGGDRLFWFSTLEALTPETVLDTPIWQIAGNQAMFQLIEASD